MCRQDVVLFDNEIVFNESIIEEREQGIKEIQHQISEVNEIFKDLAVLVHEQGVMIGKPCVINNNYHFFFKSFLAFFVKIFAYSIRTMSIMCSFIFSDDISSNIESSHTATTQASSQLHKASKSQKSSSSLVNFD